MAVHIADGYQYAVVQFLELPRSNIDDYVCVPYSWIRKRRAKDRRTTVAFPDEPRLLTDIRIKKNEKPLETWNVYMAIIKYETYSYLDAGFYIMEQKPVTSTQNEHSDYITSLPDTATDNISFPFKRIKLPEAQSKTNKKITQVMSQAKFIDQFRKTSQSPEYANLESETPLMNKTQDNSFRTGITNPKRNILYAPRNILNLKNEILRNYPEIDEDFSSLFRDCPCLLKLVAENQKRNILNQQARVPEIVIPQHRVEDFEESCQSVVIEEGETTTDQVSSMEETGTEDLLTDGNFGKEADQPAASISNIRDRWMCQSADIFTKMDSDFAHECEVTSELHQSFVRSATAIKCIKNIYEGFRNKGVKEADVVTPEDVTAEDNETTVEDKDESNQAEKEREERPHEDMNEDEEISSDKNTNKSEDNNDDDDGDSDRGDENSKNIEDDEEKEAPKKTRGHIRTFVLPAEYDPNDTRWTLKHRKSNPKLYLVELLPRTKVYINSKRLAHCKLVAKDSKTLARMLFVEIFSQTALSVCSLTSAWANAFGISGTKVRPGLDEHARTVILNFVKEHARQKNWGVFDRQTVIKSIRSKILRTRYKYGQTE